MRLTSGLRASALAIVAILALAAPVLADTCCANLPVGLAPTTADPGDTVKLIGLECRDADNSGPNALRLGRFWLATTDRAAETEPDTTPSAGLPEVLPPVEEWLAFDTVPDVVTGPGDATIIVPDLPDGRYQLWWWCDDGSGPGGGIHYSTGPRLVVGDVPDTATEPGTPPPAPRGLGWQVALLVSVALVVFVGRLRYPYPGLDRAAGDRPWRGPER